MNFEVQERPPLTFEQAIEAGKKAALRVIGERFERAQDAIDNLDYHNTWHTENVIRRTRAILSAIARADQTALDDRLMRLGEFIAAQHDTVQDYEVDEIPEGAFTKKIRKRFSEENENKSAEQAVEYMRTVNHAVFSDTDEELVRQAIRVTIPVFDMEKGTAVQPNLTGESDLIARAVALADLGAAGMDGPEVFLREGDALFREENIDIVEALAHPENLSDEQRKFFRARMLSWSEGQERFAAGRQAFLDSELSGLSEAAQDAVRALFTKFDETLQRVRVKKEARKHMSFDDLVSDFGYAA